MLVLEMLSLRLLLATRARRLTPRQSLTAVPTIARRRLMTAVGLRMILVRLHTTLVAVLTAAVRLTTTAVLLVVLMAEGISMKIRTGVLVFLTLGLLVGFLAGCSKPPTFQESFPKEGWHTYNDATRGITCYFYSHPQDPRVHFGAGCVADSQWKKVN